jgi:hypothetical protein
VLFEAVFPLACTAPEAGGGGEQALPLLIALGSLPLILGTAPPTALTALRPLHALF